MKRVPPEDGVLRNHVYGYLHSSICWTISQKRESSRPWSDDVALLIPKRQINYK